MEVSIRSRHTAVTPRLEEVVHEKIGQLSVENDFLERAFRR